MNEMKRSKIIKKIETMDKSLASTRIIVLKMENSGKGNCGIPGSWVTWSFGHVRNFSIRTTRSCMPVIVINEVMHVCNSSADNRVLSRDSSSDIVTS